MGLDDVDTPDKLYDWVEQHAASVQVYEEFMALIVNVVNNVCDDDDAEFEWNISSGLLHGEDDSESFAYLLTLKVEGTDQDLTFALRVDEETGKLSQAMYLDPDIPVNHVQSLGH